MNGCALIFGLLLAGGTTVTAKTPKLNTKSITLTVGKSKQLKVKNTKKKIKWSTSSKKIAKVSKKGKVTAVKKGSCKITAKVAGKKLVCKVTVKAKPKKGGSGGSAQATTTEKTTEKSKSTQEDKKKESEKARENAKEQATTQQTKDTKSDKKLSASDVIDVDKIEADLKEICRIAESTYSNLSDLDYVSAANYWVVNHAYADYDCGSCGIVAYMMEKKGYKTCYLCCFNGSKNDVNNYYPVTCGSRDTPGHVMVLVFTDSEHYIVEEVQGSSLLEKGKSNLSKSWVRQESLDAYRTRHDGATWGHTQINIQPYSIFSVHDKVNWIKGYDTVYDMIKGEYGCEISQLEPFYEYFVK